MRTPISTALVKRWLRGEGEQLQRELAAVSHRQERIIDLARLLLACEVPAGEVSAIIPRPLPAALEKQIRAMTAAAPAQFHAGPTVSTSDRPSGPLSPREARVLRIIEQAARDHQAELSVSDIGLQLRAHGDDASPNVVLKTLRTLRDRRLVQRPGKNRYALATTGPADGTAHHLANPAVDPEHASSKPTSPAPARQP